MSRVLLVDFNNLWNRYYFALVRQENDASNIDCFVHKIKHLLSLLDANDFYSRKILILDGNNALENKKLLLPSYKGTRSNKKDTIYHLQRIILREYILPKLSNIEVMRAEEYEADHIISILAYNFSKNQDVFIYSNDKDLLQTLAFSPRIKIGVKFTGGLTLTPFTEEEIFKKFPVENLEDIIKFRTFKGDSSDNISPAIPRLPVKVILSLIKDVWKIKELNEDLLQEFKNYTHKVTEEHFEDIKRNWELMYLDPYIPIKEIKLKKLVNKAI